MLTLTCQNIYARGKRHFEEMLHTSFIQVFVNIFVSLHGTLQNPHCRRPRAMPVNDVVLFRRTSLGGPGASNILHIYHLQTGDVSR